MFTDKYDNNNINSNDGKMLEIVAAKILFSVVGEMFWGHKSKFLVHSETTTNFTK